MEEVLVELGFKLLSLEFLATKLLPIHFTRESCIWWKCLRHINLLFRCVPMYSPSSICDSCLLQLASVFPVIHSRKEEAEKVLVRSEQDFFHSSIYSTWVFLRISISRKCPWFFRGFIRLVTVFCVRFLCFTDYYYWVS